MHRLLKRLAIGATFAVAFIAVAVAIGIYFLQYHGKIGPREAEAEAQALALTGAVNVECVRGWRRVSGSDYVCEIHWAKRPPETMYLMVDDEGITDFPI